MTINTVITRNVYDMGSATPRLLTDGTYDYVWGPTGLAYLMDASKAAKSYATDGLGSVRALTDGTKTATDTATRDAFGTLIQSTGATAQPFGFTGEVRDGETGFLYLTSRYYDPATGRFLTRDSLPSGNRYVYANDNPLRFTDPSGHLATSDAGGIACDPGTCDGVAVDWNPVATVTYSSSADYYSIGSVETSTTGTSPGDAFTWQGGSINLSLAAFGGYGQASVTIIGKSQDSSKGILVSMAGGGGTSVGGVGFSAMPVISNARSVTDFEGVFGHAGVCVGAGLLGCVEDQRGQASDGTPIEVRAAGLGVGLEPSWAGIPLPGEFHGLASNTWRILSWK